MVRFEKRKIVFEIETIGCNPVEEYLDLIDDIINVIETNDREINTSNNFNSLTYFLKEIMPKSDQLKHLAVEG